MHNPNPPSQWQNLLQNLGDWRGSFTRLSPIGELREDLPSRVALEGLEDNQTVRQTIQFFSPDTQEITRNTVLEYSTLGRSVLFFENGAFSQGSMQFSPFSEFGAEFGFVHQNRRLRIVSLLTAGELKSLTLIREQRLNTSEPDRSPLPLASWLGEWQGEAVTLYPDWRSPTTTTSVLRLQQHGAQIQQYSRLGDREKEAIAQCEEPPAGSLAIASLAFEPDPHPIQQLLLPGGASVTCPSIQPGQPFALEAGWLIAENLRQRLIRHYDDKGGWESLTLVTEQKGAD